MKQIIVLTGYKQSGKDTAYLYLRSHFTDVCRLAFADELKREVAEILGIDTDWLNSYKNHPLFRNALQFWGQYQKEQLGKDYWTKVVCDLIAADPKDSTYFITDCRFPFELEALEKIGQVCTLRILREGQVNTDKHESEVQVDKIKSNFFLRNSGNSLKEFERECKWVAQHVKEYFKSIKVTT